MMAIADLCNIKLIIERPIFIIGSRFVATGARLTERGVFRLIAKILLRLSGCVSIYADFAQISSITA
jgi:hypothetical protein